MLIRDHFQNFKSYQLPKAQLIIADVPYNLGNNAYASNPAWYKDGDNKNGESELAGKSFFDTDEDFRPAEFMHFCSTMLKAEKKPTKSVEGEPRQKGDAPCMILFCAFDQQMYFIELAKRYGLNNYINLVFRKNFSAQVLKANSGKTVYQVTDEALEIVKKYQTKQFDKKLEKFFENHTSLKEQYAKLS